MNLTSAPFPPAQEMAGLREVHPWLLPLWFAWCLGLVLWSRSLTAIVFGAGNAWIGWWAFRHIKIGIDERRWERERQRGQAATVASLNSYGESKEPSTDVAGAEGNMEGAEWLNGVMRGLWEVMDPAIFEAAAGTLEDVMQASAPAFIHQIKVVDLNHGLTPIRVAGVKAEYVQPSKTDSGDGDGDASSGELMSKHLACSTRMPLTIPSHRRQAHQPPNVCHLLCGQDRHVSDVAQSQCSPSYPFLPWSAQGRLYPASRLGRDQGLRGHGTGKSATES